MLTGRDGRGLAMRLFDELRGSDIGHPDLDGPKSLCAQPAPMLAYPLTCACHKPMLHVTRGTVDGSACPRSELILAQSAKSPQDGRGLLIIVISAGESRDVVGFEVVGAAPVS